MVNKLAFQLGEPERGDVVVFRPTPEPDRDFIKRVIGLPGESVEVRNKKVYIDGQPIAEPYVHFIFPPEPEDNGGSTQDLPDFDVTRSYGPVTVPAGHYFMMGDNRDNSTDSRFLGQVGYVPYENLVGRATIIFFSHRPNYSFLEVWKWPAAIRWNRLFVGVD